MINYAKLPSREKPNALVPYLKFLHQMEQNYPAFVEIDVMKSYETIKATLRTGIKSLLKHKWETGLNTAWWETYWPLLSVRSIDGKVYLAPTDANFEEALEIQQIRFLSGKILHSFETLPSTAVLHAICLLLDKEILEGEFHCIHEFPQVFTEYYKNIEIFKPEGSPFWILM